MRKQTFFTVLVVLFFSIVASGANSVNNRVIIKLKKGVKAAEFVESLRNTKTGFGEIRINNLFPANSKSLNEIYLLNYSSPVDAEFVAALIGKNRFVEWAEPDYTGNLAGVTPNDEYYSEQWYLRKIGMENAWETEQGAGDVTIAVIDNGLSLTHPDLAAQVWTNENEAADGVDNDGNGFVDDLHGWDFGMNDNDVSHDGASSHGTQVAGLIGATTNNNIGIASVGFNVKIMPLKITDLQSDTEVIMSAGYRAIVYAADNGADVINCSWGNYQYSHLGAEAVNYAVAKGAIVIGAAGNDGEPEIFYPAKYDNVLSVAATDSNDAVWTSSNYGRYVDIAAPGVNVISTAGSNAYLSASGTSLAAPLVSGVAALVKKHFPSLTPLQIAERVRVSAQNISAQNPAYSYLIGSGRADALTALTSENLKSARATNFIFTDEEDNVFEPGENVKLYVNFWNYLSALDFLTVTLESDDPYITITQNSFSAGFIASSQFFTNALMPFEFTIAENVPENHTAYFKLVYSDGDYSDFQWTEVLLNSTYSDMNVNNLDLTITSSGTLGFDDYPYNTKGNGLTYQNDGKIRFFEAGLLYGNAENRVMDALHIGQFTSVSNDFNTVLPFKTSIPGAEADQQGILILNDDGAGENKLGITTTLISYAYSDEENNNYIILRYLFVNNSASEISNFYAGLYFDWDLDEDDYADDIVEYDTTHHFGYAYDDGFNTISTYHGAALISDSKYNFWANANDGSGGGINVENFTDQKKWTMLSSGASHVSAGPSDISFVISGGAYSVEAGDTLDVAFALAIAPDLDDLANAIEAAREKYSQLPTDVGGSNAIPGKFVLYQNYPNPFNPTTTIKYSIPKINGVETHGRASLRIYNILGKEITTLVDKYQAPGNYTVQFDASGLPSGVYFYTLRVGNFTTTKKMILMK